MHDHVHASYGYYDFSYYEYVLLMYIYKFSDRKLETQNGYRFLVRNKIV